MRAFGPSSPRDRRHAVSKGSTVTTDSFKRSVPRVERRSKKAYASLEIEEGIRLIKAFVQVKDADIRVSLIKLAESLAGSELRT